MNMQLHRNQVFWIIIGLLFLIFGILRLGPLVFFSMAAALVFGITVHECSHAWTANQLGDPTARLQGRISLNPLKQLDPAGTAMMAITMATGIGIGWGKPTPVSLYRLRFGQRLGGAIVALAGPLSNILLAIAFGIWVRLGAALPRVLLQILYIIASTNVYLAFFNLLPVPSLDGYSVLIGLLSLIRAPWAWKAVNALESAMRYGPMVLIGLIFMTQFMRINLFGMLIGIPSGALIKLITGV